MKVGDLVVLRKDSDYRYPTHAGRYELDDYVGVVVGVGGFELVVEWVENGLRMENYYTEKDLAPAKPQLLKKFKRLINEV